jgi:dihydroorotase
MEALQITKPDDFHLHLRDGPLLSAVLAPTVRRFARAIVMPNLSPPIVSVADAKAYRDRICKSLPEGSNFEPMMTLYLTSQTAPDEIRRAAETTFIKGVKLYPRGATTHSDAGVEGVGDVFPVLEAMQEVGLPLLVHGETTRDDCDVFDRERVFLEDTLVDLVDRFGDLRIVIEHVSTEDAVQFVLEGPERVAATITPQHLLWNRNALFEGGLQPHRYCLPVLKHERHRRAVHAAAMSGHPRFFLGTDSAPHLRGRKECADGCAGIYSAPIGIEIYADAFEAAGALDRLEAFASHHGADFYGLSRNRETITLEPEAWQVPETQPVPGGELVPMGAGTQLRYRLKDES